MSIINVDDFGHEPRSSLPWLTASSTTGHEGTDLTSLMDQFGREAADTSVPAVFVQALRTGTLNTQYVVNIYGDQVRFTLAQAGTGHCDPDREHAAWGELTDAVAAANGTGCDGFHKALPAELAAAVWDHDGREICACRPGTPTGAIRRARSRIRRRLTALSPLPLLGTLTQPLTGSATAVGIALAPVVPPMHTTPPPAPVVRELGGEIARPELPYMLGLHVTAPAAPRFASIKPPDEATAPDSSPRPTANPAPPSTVPAATPTPDTSTSPTPTGSPLPEASSITSPAPAPPQTDPTADTPLDAPQDPPSGSPAPATRTAPRASHTPRGHAYGHRHGKHKQRPPHGRR